MRQDFRQRDKETKRQTERHGDRAIGRKTR